MKILIRCQLSLAPFVLLATSLNTPSFGQDSGESQATRFYYDEALPLWYDEGRVFCEAMVGGPPPTSQVVLDVEELPIDGWYELTLNPGYDARVAMDLLLADEDRFYAPVLLTARGESLVPLQELFVRFEAGVTTAAAERVLAEEGAGAIEERDWAGMPNAYRLDTGLRDGREVLELANRLAVRTDVRFAEPDYIGSGSPDSDCELLPNDSKFPSQWHLSQASDFDIDATEAWPATIGTSSILVMVFETGVEAHPDLGLGPGEDFTGQGSGGAPVYDGDCHGTAVAGCVSALMNNVIGVAGGAPGCLVASARTFMNADPNNCGGGWTASYSWSIDALVWAESIGVRVTNNSNGYGSPYSPLADKYAQTRANGMIHFGSAGNESSTTLSWPGSLPSVHAIGAMNEDGYRASFSNWGPDLAFMAPGENVLTTDRVGGKGYFSSDYGYVNGTSFASPLAASTAALLLSLKPDMTVDEVFGALSAGCVDLGPPGWDPDYGWGMLNMAAALRSAGLSAGCEYVQNPMSGRWYRQFIGSDSLSWPDAMAHAQSIGGELVTVRDQSENDWLSQMFLWDQSFFWIGYHDSSVEGQFEWVSGEAPGYENWRAGEPDDQFGADYVVLVPGAGTWMDEPYLPERRFVVEWIPGDCNENGIPDAYEASQDPSLDWNGDGKFDECESANYCSTNPNSTGVAAVIGASGSPVVADNAFTLEGWDLPQNQFGYFLTSQSTAFVPNFGGSDGILCVGSPQYRLNDPASGGQVLNSGATSTMSLTLDFNLLPGGVTLAPGETWYFQLWFRDITSAPTSNTTDGLELKFR